MSPADVRAGELREPRRAGLVGHQRRALLPQRLVAVHAGAVVAEDRLRHERRGLAGAARDVPDDVLVGHDLVGHPGERLVPQVDLALAAGRDLVVVELAGDAEPLERQHHLRAQVVQRVVRGGREVALLLAHRVAEPGLARVPVALGRVDRVVRAVRAELVRDLVEDEELALGPEERRVGDAGRDQVLLCAAGDAARVAGVRLAGDRVEDLADERERRRGRERVEHRRLRLRHEQHVRLGDALPAADRGAVEAEALVERRLVERRQRQRHVLPRPEQVAELQVDQLRLRAPRPFERLPRLGLRPVLLPETAASRVSDIPSSLAFGPQKKPQVSMLESRGDIAST